MTDKLALVTGAAGFLASHLCDRLISLNYKVLGIDNLCTGNIKNLENAKQSENFHFLHADLNQLTTQELDKEIKNIGLTPKLIFHLASPASPINYQRLSIETMLVNSLGTKLLLDLAVSYNSRFIFASTSEVYGDPEVHPQPETYWGNVNPNGPRSCYDESKRFAEALILEYAKRFGVQSVIFRIFNTYGPRLSPGDGRVVSNFISQCLKNEPMTIYGDGSQTRSLVYVDDEIEGILKGAFSESVLNTPINLGSQDEISIIDLGRKIASILGVTPKFKFLPLPKDDPKSRCPDITRAKTLLGWQPTTPLEEGISKTASWLAQEIGIAI